MDSSDSWQIRYFDPPPWEPKIFTSLAPSAKCPIGDRAAEYDKMTEILKEMIREKRENISGHFVNELPNEPMEKKKCNCSMETLMRTGCKCGGV